MFRLIEPSSGQIQNIVLVYSVSAHIMCALTEYTSTMFCIWPDDVSMSQTCSHIFNIDCPYMLCLVTDIITILLYKHNGMAPIKEQFFIDNVEITVWFCLSLLYTML